MYFIPKYHYNLYTTLTLIYHPFQFIFDIIYQSIEFYEFLWTENLHRLIYLKNKPKCLGHKLFFKYSLYLLFKVFFISILCHFTYNAIELKCMLFVDRDFYTII